MESAPGGGDFGSAKTIHVRITRRASTAWEITPHAPGAEDRRARSDKRTGETWPAMRRSSSESSGDEDPDSFIDLPDAPSANFNSEYEPRLTYMSPGYCRAFGHRQPVFSSGGGFLSSTWSSEDDLLKLCELPTSGASVDLPHVPVLGADDVLAPRMTCMSPGYLLEQRLGKRPALSAAETFDWTSEDEGASMEHRVSEPLEGRASETGGAEAEVAATRGARRAPSVVAVARAAAWKVAAMVPRAMRRRTVAARSCE